MEPKKSVKPKKDAALDEQIATAAASEETASEVAETVEEVAPPVAAKPKSKMTTTKNIRPDAGEVEIEQPEQARVDVSQVGRDDLVLVTMHETIDPAPRIGTFDCRHKIAHALIMRKNYRMPKHVAEVLVDAGKAEFLSVEG